MKARLAVASDLEALVSLAVEFRNFLAQDDPAEASFRAGIGALLRDPAVEFLIVDGAGYAQCRYRLSLWHEGMEAELEDLFVTAAARGRGTGRQLLELALERAAARGCQSIGVQTNERNRNALALYERFGFFNARARWQGGRQLWLDRSL
jgi:GNAT superfamily N-acetyltransferase